MLDSHESVSLTRSYSVLEDGKEKQLAVVTGRINPGQLLSVAIMLSDKEAALAHQEDVAAAFDDFLSSIRTKAHEHHIPV